MKKNIIREMSYNFALSVIQTCDRLHKQKSYVLSNQLLKSGTSIGANVRESQSAESKKDFIHKLSIALKESRETDYWLSLIRDSKKLSADQISPLIKVNNEIQSVLAKIIISTKRNLNET